MQVKIVRYLQRRGERDTVSILSGGGSGHEPALGGYVGEGLLASAVSGIILASPPSKQILRAIEMVGRSNEALVIA